MVIILMGVAGSGKTTIGLLLAQELHWDFYDADDFHPPGNINKIQRGLALNDDDRLPWLLELQKVIGAWLSEGKNVILACSALKAKYRQMLIRDPMNMRLVYLRGDVGLLEHRVRERKDHFLSNELLSSQFKALEEPGDALTIDVDRSPKEIVKQITDTWKISRRN